MDEKRIIDMLFDRNENGIKEATAEFGRLCHSIAFNILDNHADADECVNDAMLALWNTVPPNRPESLKAYVCKITRNQALQKYEFKNRQKRGSATVPLSELEGILSEDTLSTHISAQELGALISKFLRREKKNERALFLRRYWFFDSLKEISVRFGFSESKIKSILWRQRSRLKDFLKKEGFDI